MKSLSFLRVVLVCLILGLGSRPVHALDSKTKIMLTVAGYGTAAGTLLGVASLAFGTKARAIAQGASLGLYAGLIFGSYIVLSHAYKKNNPDTDVYPEGAGGLYNDLPIEGDEVLQYWEDLRFKEQAKLMDIYDNSQKDYSPSFNLNIVNLSF